MSLPKLTVKTAKDLVQPAVLDVLKATPVEVTAPAELIPVITWAELLKSSINAYLRNYVTDTVTGKIISVNTRFWLGFVSGIVSVLLVAFLVWQVAKAF